MSWLSPSSQAYSRYHFIVSINDLAMALCHEFLKISQLICCYSPISPESLPSPCLWLFRSCLCWVIDGLDINEVCRVLTHLNWLRGNPISQSREVLSKYWGTIFPGEIANPLKEQTVSNCFTPTGQVLFMLEDTSIFKSRPGTPLLGKISLAGIPMAFLGWRYYDFLSGGPWVP